MVSTVGLLVLLCLCIPLTVFAADSNGNAFVFGEYVEYSFSDNDTVVKADVSFPTDWISTSAFMGEYQRYLGTYKGANVSFGLTGEEIYSTLRLEMRPLGGSAYTGHDVGYQFVDSKFIDLRYVPDSTTVKFGFEVTVSSYKIIAYPTPKTTIMLYFVDSSGKVLFKYTDGFYAGISSIGDTRILVYDYSLELENLNLPADVVGVVPYMLLSDMQVDFESIDIKYMPFEFVYSMSALQYESSRNDQLQDSMKNVQQSLNEQKQAIEELPGQIGDEFQGVIEQEKEESKEEGNKFVDQVLDKLPDPSTEVLNSLKGLTDSMSYTGTDCKLKIPALVIPAIDGLIPETEIWGGAEFSFSDYLSFLPPALLTVVQSLFTIAIVLYCVYELKGIISYCLTLNDKKGG